MHLVIAGLILGIAGVWGVPILSWILRAILPAQADQYLPSSDVPSFSAKAAVTALIYGVFVFAALMVLEALGKVATHKRLRVGV